MRFRYCLIELDQYQTIQASGPFIESIKLSEPGQNSYQLMDADVLSASVDYLNDYAASESDEPFCLTANFMLPHPPYVASKDDFDAVKDCIPALLPLQRTLMDKKMV